LVMLGFLFLYLCDLFKGDFQPVMFVVDFDSFVVDGRGGI